MTKAEAYRKRAVVLGKRMRSRQVHPTTPLGRKQKALTDMADNEDWLDGKNKPKARPLGLKKVFAVLTQNGIGSRRYRSPGVFMSKILKRALLALAFATFTTHAPARAENYPTRSITIMPLLAAGTGLDITVRLYAEQLSQALGKPVVIENKPGSAGLVGISALKAAPADGYTLVVATSAVMAIRPALMKQTTYDPQKDFVPIALYVKSPFILIVDPKLPIHSVPELIKYVKDRPGQISFSSSGVGGAPHLSLEFMKQRFGFDAAHVPYRNSPQSIADVAAGHVAMAFAEAGASLPLIRDGKLRALAVTSSDTAAISA